MEKIMRSEEIYKGRIVNLRIDTVELGEKKYGKREIVEHPGGIGILAINKNKEFVLVRQYRIAMSEKLIEIPAGTIEVNEEPRIAAKRELKEETGYTANKLTYIGEYYPTPGYCTEKHFLFLAENLTKGEQNLDDEEDIECFTISCDKAIEMIRSGEISDAKTVLAILMYSHFYKG